MPCPAPTTGREFRTAYADAVSRRLPLTVAACAGFGLVPVAGLVPAVLTYRLTLVRPFMQRVPLGRRLLTKWLLRALLIALAWLQIIPVVGVLAIALMVMINHEAWRRAYLKNMPDA